jgi:nucleotide-binding universal stress UspA family protein
MGISEFKRILVAVDGSENALKVARAAVMLAKKFSSELIVFHVIPTPAAIAPTPYSVVRGGPDSAALMNGHFPSAWKDAKCFLDDIVRLAEAVGVKASELVLDNLFQSSKPS